MAIKIRFIHPEELAAFRHTQFVSMGLNHRQDDLDRVRKTFEVDRAIAAFDGSTLVGTLGCASLTLQMPGNHQCMLAGTTTVAVLPTHRRQGIMHKMLIKHFEDAREQDKPVAGLWASQTPVYGRFGYGVAAYQNELSIPAERLEFTGPKSDLEVCFIDAEKAKTILPEVYNKCIPHIPGTNSRSPNWWTYRRLQDSDASPFLYLIVKQQGEVSGYAQFTRTSVWQKAALTTKLPFPS
ncbi:MAG: GNAT family N-acetyltransferase [Limnobacter sp.]|nr:GNAT family N-acetyltransferase [Limnobacter sp.]